MAESDFHMYYVVVHRRSTTGKLKPNALRPRNNLFHSQDRAANEARVSRVDELVEAEPSTIASATAGT